MEYLDMVINEARRLHPSIGFLSRKCAAKTILPIGNIETEKDTKILIPIFEFHHDIKFFPDPEVFNPERFSRDNKHNILDITYLPFGKGNRIRSHAGEKWFSAYVTPFYCKDKYW